MSAGLQGPACFGAQTVARGFLGCVWSPLEPALRLELEIEVSTQSKSYSLRLLGSLRYLATKTGQVVKV